MGRLQTEEIESEIPIHVSEIEALAEHYGVEPKPLVDHYEVMVRQYWQINVRDYIDITKN